MLVSRPVGNLAGRKAPQSSCCSSSSRSKLQGRVIRKLIAKHCSTQDRACEPSGVNRRGRAAGMATSTLQVCLTWGAGSHNARAVGRSWRPAATACLPACRVGPRVWRCISPHPMFSFWSLLSAIVPKKPHLSSPRFRLGHVLSPAGLETVAALPVNIDQ